jgi:hypothetical protein
MSNLSDEPAPINSWIELAERLDIYAKAASTFGGMNDLDRTLYMAAAGINLLIERVPGCDFTACPPEVSKPTLIVVK